MGAAIEMGSLREQAGEPVADIAVRAGPLRAVEVPAERAPRMIDEYPILSVVAACAEGTTRLNGLAELRVKESDRLGATAAGLRAAGVSVTERDDGLDIAGRRAARRPAADWWRPSSITASPWRSSPSAWRARSR